MQFSECHIPFDPKSQFPFMYVVNYMAEPKESCVRSFYIIYSLILRPLTALDSLTLLRYHEKSYVNSTMGSIWPHLKKNKIKSQFIAIIFSSNTILYRSFTPVNINGRH
jgi:hypothetical protein